MGSHRRGHPPEAPEAPRRRPSPHVRDWRVGTKLAAALVVPSVAFLVLAGMQTVSVVSGATALNSFAGQVALARPTTALLQELQQERDRTLGELAALGPSATAPQISTRLAEVMPPIYDSVNHRMTEFQKAAQSNSGGSAAWRSALSTANEQLNQLGQLRAGVYNGILRGNTVADTYTRGTNALLGVLEQPSPGEGHEGLNRAVLAYVELAQVKEIDSLLRARLFMVASTGKFSGSDKVDLSDLHSQQLSANAQFRADASEEQVQLYDRTLSVPEVEQAAELEEAASAAEDHLTLDPATWWKLSTVQHSRMRDVEVQLVENAIHRADSASAAQWRQTALVTALVLLVLLAAMAASVAIGRSMARSLNQLRAQALSVAQTQLPQLVERLRRLGPRDTVEEEVETPTVRSADEIGDVAEAFHAVHRSAVHLAAEQATMRRNVNAIFVNLARRSQVLVERQLELLDKLEQTEADAELLGNLFQLDHLAARMRRNDDNLLILAGSEPRRRWAEPVALSTVVVAAVAEIEQYRRVQHDIDGRLYLVGRAISDLAHLLAELLENATQFSPPESSVLVKAGLASVGHSFGGQASGGQSAVIEVVDTGMGMSAQALAEANETLATPPPVDVAAAERMGLVVVSHLATRHGIRVLLEPTPPASLGNGSAGGLTAAVWLPPQLLAPMPEPQELADAPASGVLAQISRLLISGSERAEEVSGVEAPAAQRPRPEPEQSGDMIPTGRLPEGPPEIPVTGGTNEAGLPLRVPMAQLPVDEGTDRTDGLPAGDGREAKTGGKAIAGRPAGYRPVRVTQIELDPEEVGGSLARLYRGVRQAQAEDAVVPVFQTGDGQAAAPAPPGAAVAQEQRYEEERQ